MRRRAGWSAEASEAVLVLGSCHHTIKVHLFFFSSRRRHTRLTCDWSSDVCSSDLDGVGAVVEPRAAAHQGPEGGAVVAALGVVKVGQAEVVAELVGEDAEAAVLGLRSEERRVGKECRSRWSAYHLQEEAR